MRGVYRLTCDDPDLIYYGSSDDIYHRQAQHKYSNKKWKEDNTNDYCSSSKLYEVGGVEVELVLECSEDISKLEMREIEQTYIDNDECVNTNKSFRTEEELKQQQYESQKKYRKTDKRKEAQKKYRNNEKVKAHKIQYQREYRLKKKQIKDI
jgi:hypothetical protein